MTTQNYYEGIKNIVHISTAVLKNCKHCNFKIGSDDFEESINHYINDHGYKILHVGQETRHGDAGKPWHSTVAILGK